MAIIECVPNISEGRRNDVVAAITAALAGVAGVRVLDVQSDASHHRSVLTLAGAPGPLKQAAELTRRFVIASGPLVRKVL